MNQVIKSFKPQQIKISSTCLQKTLPPKSEVPKSKNKNNTGRNKFSKEKCKVQKVNLNINSSQSSDTFSSVKYESCGALKTISRNQSINKEEVSNKAKYHSNTRVNNKPSRKEEHSSKPNKNKSAFKIPFFDLKENQFYKKYNLSESSESNLSPSRFYESKDHTKNCLISLAKTNKINLSPRLIKDVDRNPNQNAKLSQNSNKTSIGAGIRQTMKMKTMTNMKQNLDSSSRLDQLAEFLQNKMINETQPINNNQSSEINEIRRLNIEDKFCLTEFQKQNKKKQRVHKSPDPIALSNLEARRGSKTPLITRDVKQKLNSDLTIFNNLHNNECFISEDKKTTFISSGAFSQNDNITGNSKDGKSRNNQLKYSTYSKQANIAKITRDGNTRQTFETRNCNINLKKSENSITNESLQELKTGSFIFNHTKRIKSPDQNNKLIDFSNNSSRNDINNRLGFITYNKSNCTGGFTNKVSPIRTTHMSNIKQIMQEK